MLESAVRSEQEFHSQSFTRRRVLVVSEDYLLLRHYVELLREFGLTPVPAASYLVGLNRLKAEAFDAIVVDQGGQNFEGRCVVESAAESTKPARTVVVTRRRDFACHLAARRLGASAYLQHPADGYLEAAVS